MAKSDEHKFPSNDESEPRNGAKPDPDRSGPGRGGKSSEKRKSRSSGEEKEESSGYSKKRKSRSDDEEESSDYSDRRRKERSSKERKSRRDYGSEDDSEVYSESEEDRRMKRKRKERKLRRSYSESEEDRSKKRKETKRRKSRSESESDEEERRRRRRKRKERKRREEKERERRRKRKKEKEKKKKEKEKGKVGAVTNSWGKYGIIKETDMWNKRPEFTAWLLEVKQVNIETLPNWEEKQMFKQFMEDHNTATFTSKKYYGLDAYHRRKVEKEMKRGSKKVVDSERTVFDDEEQRRLELLREREKRKEQEVEELKRSMQSGLATPDAVFSTAVTSLKPEDAFDPNRVKCVVDNRGYALYFSRGLIPFNKSGNINPGFPYMLHLGIQSYDSKFLKIYPELTPTSLQLEEDLEQLKVLENGYKMKVIKVDHDAHGVDAPEDVEKIEKLMRERNLS